MSDWRPGYSQAELDDAQSRFDLRFPPDLIALLRERRPLRGYDWAGDSKEIKRALTWPLEGLLFDVEQNSLWIEAWGERPAKERERAEIVSAAVASAPKLIPLLAHRYLPESPCEPGNPVFSVYQSDIIIYGSNLQNYFSNEFSHLYVIDEPVRYIPFWSDFVDGFDGRD